MEQGGWSGNDTGPRASDVHEGGCLCGAVRYRVRGQPVVGLVCHCTFCQRRTGAAFAVLGYFEDCDVEFNRGRRTVYEHRSDESGRWLRTEFCPVCGTTVTHTAERRPELRGIAGGTFDDPGWLTIERHIWVRSARRWVSIPAGVEVFQEGSPAPPTTEAES
jgi:hypothetical protein